MTVKLGKELIRVIEDGEFNEFNIISNDIIIAKWKEKQENWSFNEALTDGLHSASEKIDFEFLARGGGGGGLFFKQLNFNYLNLT